MPDKQFALALQYYQEAEALSQKGNYTPAFPLLQKANKILLPSQEEDTILQANIWYALSNCYSAKQDYETALGYNQKALDSRMKIFGEIGEPTLEAAVSRGWISSQLGKYREALKHFQKILNKCLITPPTNSLQYGVLYNLMGNCYLQMEDYWKGILYFQKSIEILQALEEPNIRWEAISYECIGACYAQVGEVQEAFHYLQKALDKFKLGKYDYEISHIYIIMGGIYNRLREHQKAIDSYQKSLTILKDLETYSQYSFELQYMGLGRAYGNLSRFEEAHEYLQKSLDIQLQKHGFKHPRVAHTYYVTGNLYSKQKSYLPALKTFQKGLQAFIPFFEEQDIYQNPSLEELQSGANNVSIILMANKADTFRKYYLEDVREAKNIGLALESAELAVLVMEQKRQGYHSDHSKLSMEETHKKTYQIALEAAHTTWVELQTQNAFEKAFLFAEKAKAILLLSAIQHEVAKVKSPISNSLLQKEQALKTQLTELDKELQNLKKSKENSSAKDSKRQALQVEFLEYHQQYNQLMKQMEETYPNYYQIKHETQTISIAKIQSILHPQELMIQYCLYPNQLFIFAIGVDSLCLEVVELDDDLIELIDVFQRSISLSNLESYVSLAHQLYELTLKPIEAEWNGKKELTIIPDGALHRLNFDALIRPDSSTTPIEIFSQLPYLLREFQVRYHYSATLIGQSYQKKQLEVIHEIKDGFFGVAPVKFGKRATGASGYLLKSKGEGREIVFKSGGNNRDVLVDLEETEVEVKKVYELFEEQKKEAIALFYDMASKENLLEHIEGYKYVLLSTHGFSDTEHSSLSGLNLYTEGENNDKNSDESKLYISDIMNLQLSADLTVLSSCESGLGKLQQGEGMMALHRAFLYAGVQNIVYSLFKVPQDSTSQLVQTMFNHVLAGDSYSAALRKAKLDLIENDVMEPIDWAGFALIGV